MLTFFQFNNAILNQNFFREFFNFFLKIIPQILTTNYNQKFILITLWLNSRFIFTNNIPMLGS